MQDTWNHLGFVSSDSADLKAWRQVKVSFKAQFLGFEVTNILHKELPGLPDEYEWIKARLLPSFRGSSQRLDRVSFGSPRMQRRRTRMPGSQWRSVCPKWPSMPSSGLLQSCKMQLGIWSFFFLRWSMITGTTWTSWYNSLVSGCCMASPCACSWIQALYTRQPLIIRQQIEVAMEQNKASDSPHGSASNGFCAKVEPRGLQFCAFFLLPRGCFRVPFFQPWPNLDLGQAVTQITSKGP